MTGVTKVKKIRGRGGGGRIWNVGNLRPAAKLEVVLTYCKILNICSIKMLRIKGYDVLVHISSGVQNTVAPDTKKK